MTAPVLAIVAAGKTVGIALTVGVDVVEACTVETAGRGAALDDVDALVALGLRALTVADALITTHSARGAVWTVARPVAPSRDGQQRRAISGSAHVVGAAVAAGVTAGVILGGLHARGIIPVLGDADSRDDKRDGTPALVTGHVPADWLTAHPARHRRGADRQPQRIAYWLAQRAPAAPAARPALPTTRPVPAVVPVVAVVSTPVDARGYAAALIAHVRAADPQTDSALLAAAREALATTPIPDGGRSLTAVDLAVTCVLRTGIATHLWAFEPDLRARLGAITTPTPLRSTR